ncbi:MAG: hypothetical protein CO093_08845 [Alphaproteobacteria bacterium CG_4_9_14_3_um_filter_47_13]|nr:MAG: hypothetical protein CO093_08845 [Alphaproteobacteria bacterium CG_4_9_14_3_um_filter_47_13]
MTQRILCIHAFLFTFFTLALFFSQPAFARNTKDDIKTLEHIFGDVLEQYKDLAKSGDAELVTEGKIMVEPSGSYYAVTLPHMRLEQADGSYTDIGMISVNTLPGDTSEQWKMTVALPTPIIYYDSQNKSSVTVEIKNQNFAGIWHETLKNFIKLNAQYGDIIITQSDDQTRISIPVMKVIADMTPDGKGLWSGSGDVILSGLHAHSDRTGGDVRLGEMKITSTVKDYSFDAVLDYQEKISALTESQSGQGKKASSAHVMGLYNLIADFMGSAWDGFGVTVAVRDFSLSMPKTAKASARNFKMDHSKLGFNMTGFRSGLVTMGITSAYDGLQTFAMSAEDKALVPDHVNIDLSINNLPYKEMAELGRTSLQGVTETPQAGALVGMNAAMMLPQLLTKAQTNLTLKNTYVGNNDYNILTNAMMKADLKAALGATGNARTEIYGIDYLVDSFNKIVSRPDLGEARKTKIQKSLAMLSVIKMVGQMEKDAKGRDIRTYHLELNEQGQTLLNGTDLKALMETLNSTRQ